MDFLPTFASIFEVDLPTDRPVDGIDQLGYLTSEQSRSHRENVVTFVGPRRACGSRPMAYLHDGHAPLGQQPEFGGVPRLVYRDGRLSDDLQHRGRSP